MELIDYFWEGGGYLDVILFCCLSRNFRIEIMFYSTFGLIIWAAKILYYIIHIYIVIYTLYVYKYHTYIARTSCCFISMFRFYK